MKPKQGTGRFQWNAGAWFGSQVGSTLWLFAASCQTFQKSVAAATWLIFCAAAPNIVGSILWMKRDRLAPYPAIQFLIATVGVFTLLALLEADRFRVLPIIDTHWTTTPRQAYRLMCLFPILMAFFAFQNKTRRANPDALPNTASPHR